MDFLDLWVDKYRPEKLSKLLLSDDVKAFFEHIEGQEEKTVPHLLFIGPQGTGKSTLAKIIVNDILNCQYLYINASEQNSIETVRGIITNFIQTKSIDGNMKVIILDEADGLSNHSGNGSSAQDALRNLIEEYSAYCRFIFTANYMHKISAPLLSRVQTFYITPPRKEFVIRCVEILKAESITVSAEMKPELIKLVNGYYPDLRKCINELQKYSITGTFKTPEHNTDQDVANIATTCFEMLLKKDVLGVRKFIIEKEQEFLADYQILLKKLFDVVFNCDLSVDIKKNMLILVADGLYNHQIVLDKEINFFATCIKLGSLL